MPDHFSCSYKWHFLRLQSLNLLRSCKMFRWPHYKGLTALFFSRNIMRNSLSLWFLATRISFWVSVIVLPPVWNCLAGVLILFSWKLLLFIMLEKHEFSDLNKICNRLRQNCLYIKKICFESIIAWWEKGYNRVWSNSEYFSRLHCVYIRKIPATLFNV